MAQALRETFLERAACFASTSSPSTSAFLLAENLALLADSHTAIKPALRSTCCLACGGLLVPGWTSSLEREKTTSGLHSAVYSGKRGRLLSRKHILHTCHSCHRRTVITVKKPTKLKGGSRVAFNKSIADKSPSEGPSFTKSNAKQRARERKSHQGLQALISSKAKLKTAASTPSFDLMDFMKQ